MYISIGAALSNNNFTFSIRPGLYADVFDSKIGEVHPFIKL
jgi:hypothetical protein